MASGSRSVSVTAVRIPVGDHVLDGDVWMPADPAGVVLFAHGSGSSRHSPRNQFVAHALNRHHLGTVLVDLLTAAEDSIDEFTSQYRFDIPLLAARLSHLITWLGNHPATATVPVGLFGASTGAAAALMAAAEKPDAVAAVVSRGGRPDLAGPALPRVKAPTLLIVGGLDTAVIQMNRDASVQMVCPVALEVVPGASHLFEEPGTLDRVAALAGDWFARHFQPAGALR